MLIRRVAGGLAATVMTAAVLVMSAEPADAATAARCYNANHCWGFDTASPITNVRLAGGKADFVGRYIDSGGGPTALTASEVARFRKAHVRVWLIADLTGGCTSAAVGRNEATTAARAAGRLHVSKQAVLFLDIEPTGGPGATTACLNAYANQMIREHRRPGFYENPLPTNDFDHQFCAANAQVHKAPLWSQQPNGVGATTGPKGSPAFKPTRPTCKNNTVGWQYNNTTGYDEDEITPAAARQDLWLP